LIINQVHTPRPNRYRPRSGDLRRWVAAAAVLVMVIVGAVCGIFLPGNGLDTTHAANPSPSAVAPATVPPASPEAYDPAVQLRAYGIDIRDCQLVTRKVKRSENLSNILHAYGVGYSTVMDLAKKADGVFDVRGLRPNRPYSLIIPENAAHAKPTHFIYEISPVDYVVFTLEAPRSVIRGQKPVTRNVAALDGAIASSLWQSMADAGGKPALISALSDIFAWSVDLHYLREGDSYRVLYEEEFIDGRFISIGRILAAQIRQGDVNHDAFFYEDQDCSGYFDSMGNSLDREFLKSPVRYSRISSRFSRHRLHPVLKTVKPHLGTDYAAPVGTPVMSTADGTVIAAGYDNSNGNYVKIRHTGTYTTQYLHLSRFAKGIRNGKLVRQGDIIGAVGATGMATGPHLCYRFWKNGRQIDPLNTPMPSSRKLNAEQMASFSATLTQFTAAMNNPSENLTLAQQN